jgi:hypothetical protein
MMARQVLAPASASERARGRAHIPCDIRQHTACAHSLQRCQIARQGVHENRLHFHAAQHAFGMRQDTGDKESANAFEA